MSVCVLCQVVLIVKLLAGVSQLQALMPGKPAEYTPTSMDMAAGKVFGSDVSTNISPYDGVARSRFGHATFALPISLCHFKNCCSITILNPLNCLLIQEMLSLTFLFVVRWQLLSLMKNCSKLKYEKDIGIFLYVLLTNVCNEVSELQNWISTYLQSTFQSLKLFTEGKYWFNFVWSTVQGTTKYTYSFC